LQFCFDAVARGTIADGALLDIEVIAGVGFCEQCDRAVAMAARYDACLLCGSTKLRIIAGRDLRLVDMEVD
jgi:hydrogenase nickel incorporation protein HypA/HybF